MDTVLFLLRNEDGQQKIPLKLNMGPKGLSLGAVASAAAGVLGQLIGDAVASAPLRFGGTLTDIMGMDNSPTPTTKDSLYVEYAGGALQPLGGFELALQPVVAALRENSELKLLIQQQLGPADLALAERLASPSPEAVNELVSRLRQRKTQIMSSRSQSKANAQAFYLVGNENLGSIEAAKLRVLDRSLAETEQALDEAFVLLRPGAERRAGRRAKAAARALAQERLDRIESALLNSRIPSIAERIDVRRARPGDQRQAPEGEAPLDPSLGGRITLTPKTPQ